MITIKCKVCRKSFQSYPSHHREYCSHSCHNTTRTGLHNPAWKGGRHLHNGYIVIRKPKHPDSRHGYVFKHRLVMEKQMGRYFLPHERVHHINGNRLDNRVENLIVLTSRKHTTMHGRNHLGQFIKDTLTT